MIETFAVHLRLSNKTHGNIWLLLRSPLPTFSEITLLNSRLRCVAPFFSRPLFRAFKRVLPVSLLCIALFPARNLCASLRCQITIFWPRTPPRDKKKKIRVKETMAITVPKPGTVSRISSTPRRSTRRRTSRGWIQSREDNFVRRVDELPGSLG